MSKIFKILNIHISSFVAHSFLSILVFANVFIFKNEHVTAFPANPYFRSKSTEHDVL